MNTQIEQVKLLLTQRNFEAAEQLLRGALAQNPADAEVLNLLGVSQELRGHLQAASQFFRAALCFKPDYTPAQQNLKRVTTWPYFTKGVSEDLKPNAEIGASAQ